MIDDGRCADCGGLRAAEHRCAFPGLVAALKQRGVRVTDNDERMLRWAAGFFDRPTREWFVGVITRAASAGVGNRLRDQLLDGCVQRVELVTENVDRVAAELVEAGAQLETAVRAHEVGTKDGQLRWRQGSLKIGEVPLLVKSAMKPVTCRDPEIDLGDVGEWPDGVETSGEPGAGAAS